MARKAVQGYPEKSYYDNTRYLGIVATTDPLNEGLFKHMVNFDVSDTGQSVTPREGFLTTTIKNANAIFLSNQTIIFRDNNLGDYILFDVKNNVGYVADISSYKAKDNNYYLPIKKAIATIDWKDLFNNVLIRFNSTVRAFYINRLNTRPLVDGLPDVEGALSDTINEYNNKLTIINDTKIEHIYDEFGISKALCKVTLTTATNPLTTFSFIIQLVVKKDIVNGEDVYTLLIDGIKEMFAHPTIIPTERNLAVSRSIIPEVMQNLYTSASGTNPRPSGHISTLGNFFYVFDNEDNYVTNFIERSTDYVFRPFFDLNPAYLELNNSENNNDKWAYRFDIFNTSTDVNDKTKDVVYRSPWMTYTGSNADPQPVFTVSRRNAISLGNTNRKLNHYKDARYVIFIFPKGISTVATTTSSTREQGVITQTTSSITDNLGAYIYQGQNNISNYDTAKTRQNTWYNDILGLSNITGLDKVTDLATFREAITALDANAVFYVYDLYNPPASDRLGLFDLTMQSVDNASNIKQVIIDKLTQSELYTIFKTGSQVLDMIAENNLFVKEHVVFKAFPYAVNNVHTFTDNRHKFESNVNFGTQAPVFYYEPTNNAPTIPNYSINTKIQNLYNSRVYNLTSNSPVTWNLIGQTVGDPAFVINLVKDEFYLDTRLDRWYKWDGVTRYSSETTTFNGAFILNVNAANTAVAITSPIITTITNQWIFHTLNTWPLIGAAISNFGPYKNAYNSFITAGYGFFENVNNQRIVQFSSNIIKTITSVATTPFTSSARFGNQIPKYRSTIPTSSTPGNNGDLIHISSTGRFYIRQNDTWILVTELINDVLVIITEAVPTAFVQNKFYLDTRTNIRYVYTGTSGYNGTLNVEGITNIEGFPNLQGLGFFDKGFNGIFYMKPFSPSELLYDDNQVKNYSDTETLKIAWDTIALKQTFNVQYTFDDIKPTYIVKTTTIESEQIQTSNNLTVFEDSRLLVWNKNVLYISEEGKFYWFKERTKIEFAEEIVKVLQYKQIILVFTTQHLYAVYRVETTTTQVNTTTNQLEQNVTGVAWLKQIVLYNLLVKKEYADVIQIFNQMVLFYSEDGQLLMIRPSNQIDDQTRFSIQYFNKAANDILKNYDIYINERLASYGSTMRIKKEEVKIKALVSINFIKIIYYVPGVITYMLIYDVINNRYTAYDSLTFTNIFDKRFIESGDLFVTEQNSRLYFTFPFVEPNVRDNYADMAITNNFKREGINCLIDTGNLNLNNHLNKRFRDLHVTFKNLNATNVLFNLETMIDEIIAKPFYDEKLQVIDTNNISYYVTVKTEDKKDLIELVDVNQISETATDVVKYSLTNNLFENNNILMDFSEYTSSKLLTHRTSILGMGKVFRIKLQFISKGLYKLQGFGIIYKERRI